MGAFIQMKEMPPDRRALFTIAVAGPLSGLVLAIPLTLLGLYLSTVGPLPTEGPYLLEGNSLLYAGMKLLIFGQWLPNGSEDVLLHPIAWAGWAGMLVTALNLLPAGQLDGGHVIFALLGRRWGQIVTYGVIGLMIAMGFSWPGWWVWAVMILFLANRHVPILNDVTPLTERQRLIGLFMLVIFVLMFTPTPLTLVE
jgi:membrane-associated protease RseP (regulator of RpoE activity)